MKNIQTILNIGFGIAILALLTLHFTSSPAGSAEDVTVADTTSVSDTSADIAVGDAPIYVPNVDISKLSTTELPIAHINAERFGRECKYLIESRKKMERKMKIAREELAKEEENLKIGIQSLQISAQNGSISEANYMREAESLERQRQELLRKQQDKSNALMKHENELQNELKTKLDNYLTKYSDEFKFSYIIGSGSGTNIMWASDSLDITDEILKGMNSDYAAGK